MLHAPHIIDMSCMQKKEKEEEKEEELRWCLKKVSYDGVLRQCLKMVS